MAANTGTLTAVAVRNAIFKRVDFAAAGWWNALDALDDGPDWEAELEPYFEEYGEIGTGPSARGPALFELTVGSDRTTVRQVLEDPDGDHGWSFDAVVDVEESDALGEIVFDEITITAG